MYDQKTICLAIIGFVTFVGDAPRGILFAALWPLCDELGGTTVDLGLLVAIFSVGRLVASTPLGILSDLYRHRFVLLISTMILTFGAILWANVPFLGGLPALYVAQFFLGLGTGSLGVTRSYVAEQTSPKERTVMLARLSALQYAGFAATPLIGSALVVLGQSISSYWGYALPAYLVVLLALMTWVLLYYPFVDYDEDEVEFDQPKSVVVPFISEEELLAKKMLESAHNDTKEIKESRMIGYSPPSFDEKPSNVSESTATTTSNVTRESIAPNPDSDNFIANPMLMKKTELTAANAEMTTTNPVQNQASFVEARPTLASAAGSVSRVSTTSKKSKLTTVNEHTIAYDRVKNIVFYMMIFQNFTTRGCVAIYETQMSRIFLDNFNQPELVLGLTVSLAGILGTLQMLYYKQLWTDNFSSIALMVGGIMVMSFADVFVINWVPNISQDLWRAIVGLFLMYSIGYPVGNSAVLGCFSNLQKTGRQATAQSNFAFMGSVARVVFPIVTGFIESYVGDYSSFSVALFFSSLSVILISYLAQAIVYCSTVDSTESNRRILVKLLDWKFFTFNQWVWIGVNCVAAGVAVLTIIDQIVGG